MTLPSRRLIHGRYADFNDAELLFLRAALPMVPGASLESLDDLWAQFERNHATVFYGRDDSGQIAFFTFAEIFQDTRDNSKEFFLKGAFSMFNFGDIVESAFPQLENFARLLGCRWMKLKTARMGLIRKLGKLPGWRILHAVDDQEFLLGKVLA